MPESQRQRLLSLWRKAVRCTAGADKHADVYTICGELSITPLLHRWALSFALQVRRCYLNIAPAQLCDKLVRPCHKHSTRGNNSSLYPFRSSSLGYRDRHPSVINFHHCSRKTVAEPVGCTLPVFVDMANFTSSAPPGSGIVFFD